MTTLKSRGVATYADLAAVPDHQVAELILGDLHVSPRPAGAHAVSASALGMEIGSPFSRGRGGPGGWWIIDEPELHLGANVLVPDLAGWRRDRLPHFPKAAFVEVAPDWVCEVFSPQSHRVDRIRKIPLYAQSNVAFAWLVDPIATTLEVYRLEHGRWTLLSAHEGAQEIHAEPFEAVLFALGALWEC